jgi:hypothetical protein
MRHGQGAEVQNQHSQHLLHAQESGLVNARNMKNICLSMTESTLELTDEIGEALEAIEGKNPGRSHVVRLAVIALRKRMSDEGLLKETGT